MSVAGFAGAVGATANQMAPQKKKKKKKIKLTLVSAAGSGSGMSFGAPSQGGTKAQKKFKKKLAKQKDAYKLLKGYDANPELAF